MICLALHESLQEFLLRVERFVECFVQKIMNSLIMNIALIKIPCAGLWSFESFRTSICCKLILSYHCPSSFGIERLSKIAFLISRHLCLILRCDWYPISSREHEKFSKFIQSIFGLKIALGRLEFVIFSKAEIWIWNVILISFFFSSITENQCFLRSSCLADLLCIKCRFSFCYNHLIRSFCYLFSSRFLIIFLGSNDMSFR